MSLLSRSTTSGQADRKRPGARDPETAQPTPNTGSRGKDSNYLLKVKPESQCEGNQSPDPSQRWGEQLRITPGEKDGQEELRASAGPAAMAAYVADVCVSTQAG